MFEWKSRPDCFNSLKDTDIWIFGINSEQT